MSPELEAALAEAKKYPQEEIYAIIGSRDFPKLSLVKRLVDSLPPNTIVISGGARGVDRAAVDFAKARGLKTIEFPADWEGGGKAACFERNTLMVEACDKLYAFSHNDSSGSADSIAKARQANKLAEIIWSRS